MTPTIPTAQEVQDQVLATVRKGQEAALEAIRNVADAVTSVTTKLPAVPARLTNPLANVMPAPEAVVARVFDFAGALLAQQRKFAEETLKATAALRPAAKAGEAASE